MLIFERRARSDCVQPSRAKALSSASLFPIVIAAIFISSGAAITTRLLHFVLTGDFLPAACPGGHGLAADETIETAKSFAPASCQCNSRESLRRKTACRLPVRNREPSQS